MPPKAYARLHVCPPCGVTLPRPLSPRCPLCGEKLIETHDVLERLEDRYPSASGQLGVGNG